MRRHIKDESVDLCYIDPPFNSNRDYFQIYNNSGQEDRAQAQAFTDTWTWDTHAVEGLNDILANTDGIYPLQTLELLRGLKAVLGQGALLAYLVSMTQRINQIHRVLKPTGSFYLHCDPTASHYLKLVLDSVFVTQGGDFKSEIIWKRTNARSTIGRYPSIHDVILFYVKSNKFNFSSSLIPTEKQKLPHTLINGVDGKYQTYELTAPGLTKDGNSGKEWRGFNPAKFGRHWANNHETMDAWHDAGLIHWPKNNGFPRRRAEQLFNADARTVTVGDVWTDIDRLNQTAAERLGYPTQKPEALLERIIAASSDEGDVVLDAYCGCGTTIAVAQRLKRQWIGIDITYQSIGVILKRLVETYGKEIGEHTVLAGIPKDMAAAQALATKKDDRVRKEFEKWAVLTYSRHQAIINSKKGADAGIDGVQLFPREFGSDALEKVVFQVKSGHVGRGDIAKLRGDMAREDARLAVFLTLETPTANMKAEALAAGTWKYPLMQRDYPQIQIVTVEEMLRGVRSDLPPALQVLKKSSAKFADEQTALDLSGE